MNLNNMIIPGVMCGILAHGLYHRVDIFECFLQGAREGFETAIRILPALVALMTCVGMFSASGALDILSNAAEPLCDVLGIPHEVLPFAILRPISGSGGMTIFNRILEQFGPDGYIGRVASVMQGSSETTFYTIAVYYGAIGVTSIRHTLPASLIADIVGFVMSAAMVRLLFGNA